MKKLLVVLTGLMLFAACSTQQKSAGTSGLKEVKSDSTEYGIIILDPEFEHWYLTRYTAGLDRDNEIYRMFNRTAVMNWNDYFIRGKYRNIIENRLDYDYNTDYGIEVNRKLYWYFKFVEEKYKIRLFH